jgi:hypothetical protein
MRSITHAQPRTYSHTQKDARFYAEMEFYGAPMTAADEAAAVAAVKANRLSRTRAQIIADREAACAAV